MTDPLVPGPLLPDPPSQPAPAIPPVPPPGGVAEKGRSPYGMVFRLNNFRRLWIGMTISSLGDWIGLFALLSITNRLSPDNTFALAGLMIFRVLPAFVFGPIAGVLLDRIDRRKAMIVSDCFRALLIGTVPFVHNLPTLYAITFLLEVVTLVWLPAKDALIPDLVPKRLLVVTNSLALFTTYGVFPLGALAFSGLVGLAELLATHIAPLRALDLNQENLALWIDTTTFLASAIIVSRVRVPQVPRQQRPLRLGVLWDELVEGLRYLREKGEVARVMRAIAFALVGGAVVFSLGAPYSTDVLGGGPKGFGLIVAAVGTGMGLGVFILGFVGDRAPKGWVAALGAIFAGMMLLGAGVTTHLGTAVVVSGLFGAFAGIANASLLALLQEMVAEEVRGRTFAAVQVVIRIGLFTSLIVFPALAQLYSNTIFDGATGQGIRLAMATGGLVTCAAGLYAAWDVYRGKIDATSDVSS